MQGNVSTFEEVEKDPAALGQAVTVIAIAALASLVGNIFRTGIGTGIIMLVATLVGYAVWTIIVVVVGTKLMPEPGTKADFVEGFRVIGFAASPGVVEGTARYVASLEQFDEVQDGDILVCRMTNPAWVVLFTKIRGLVTEAGGTISHPAVVAREFGIPAVVGTTNAGDRIRVNGTTGVVEILA